MIRIERVGLIIGDQVREISKQLLQAVLKMSSKFKTEGVKPFKHKNAAWDDYDVLIRS